MKEPIPVSVIDLPNQQKGLDFFLNGVEKHVRRKKNFHSCFVRQHLIGDKK